MIRRINRRDVTSRDHESQEQRTVRPRVISCLKVQRPGGDSDYPLEFIQDPLRMFFFHRSYLNFDRRCNP